MADDDERELFERALESMSPKDVYRGKFGANAEGDEQGPEEPSAQSQGAREELARLREQREMERAFADVQPIDGASKYHRPEPILDDDSGEFDDARAEFEAAMAKAGAAAPEPPPEPAASLAETAGHDVHTINLRAMQPDEAITQLGVFVDLASKDDHQIIRIRIGRNPRLLAEIKDWFRGPGLSYALEFQVQNESGDAAIFARLRHQKRA